MVDACPICLNEMNEADVTYPILCDCGYNFCVNCIEHMIESSNSPTEMASDGNLAVKLRLQCPQCRSDLKDSLDYTILMRKAETFSKLLNVKDSELKASELRQKHALEDKQLVTNLKNAQNAYSIFFKTKNDSNGLKGGTALKELTKDRGGDDKKHEKPEPYVDDTLFNGLEYFMSKEEQYFVVELMTSGESFKLAQAAQILNGIAEISRSGGVQNSSIYTKQQTDNGSTTRRSNVTQRQLRTTRSNSAAVGRALAMGKSEKDRKEHAKLQKLESLKKRHPLPARMPNYIVLPSAAFRRSSPFNRRFPLQFLDDEWDGTIADAFSRAFVSHRNATVTKKQAENMLGVKNILNAADTGGVNNAMEATISGPRNRVLISKVKSEAGQQGAQSGDVVTHLNGEEFNGNAEDLRKAILFHAEKTSSSDLTFILNADNSTAAALRLRSMVLASANKLY